MEFAAISRVEFKDPNASVEELLARKLLAEVQVLEREKNGAYIVFIRSAPTLSSVLSILGITSGYLFPPIGIEDDKIKLSFLGSEAQVKEFLEGINALKIHYHVALLTDAEFSPVSPLNQLTEKQREILLAAYKHGYYAVPRKINSKELSKKLGLANSTMVEHLRKAESRLLTRLLEQ